MRSVAYPTILLLSLTLGFSAQAGTPEEFRVNPPCNAVCRSWMGIGSSPPAPADIRSADQASATSTDLQGVSKPLQQSPVTNQVAPIPTSARKPIRSPHPARKAIASTTTAPKLRSSAKVATLARAEESAPAILQRERVPLLVKPAGNVLPEKTPVGSAADVPEFKKFVEGELSLPKEDTPQAMTAPVAPEIIPPVQPARTMEATTPAETLPARAVAEAKIVLPPQATATPVERELMPVASPALTIEDTVQAEAIPVAQQKVELEPPASTTPVDTKVKPPVNSTPIAETPVASETTLAQAISEPKLELQTQGVTTPADPETKSTVNPPPILEATVPAETIPAHAVAEARVELPPKAVTIPVDAETKLSALPAPPVEATDPAKMVPAQAFAEPKVELAPSATSSGDVAVPHAEPHEFSPSGDLIIRLAFYGVLVLLTWQMFKQPRAGDQTA